MIVIIIFIHEIALHVQPPCLFTVANGTQHVLSPKAGKTGSEPDSRILPPLRRQADLDGGIRGRPDPSQQHNQRHRNGPDPRPDIPRSAAKMTQLQAGLLARGSMRCTRPSRPSGGSGLLSGVARRSQLRGQPRIGTLFLSRRLPCSLLIPGIFSLGEPKAAWF